VLFLTLVAVAISQTALAAQVKLGAPAEIAQVDLAKLGGSVINQLAWSDDGRELYLQTSTLDKKGLPKDVRHFVVPADGGALKKIATEPDYAIAYWVWKAGQTAPDDLAFKIDVSVDRHLQSGSALPRSAPSGVSASTTVYSMILKGEVIGEWTDGAAVAGATFGWGPKGTHLVAYADRSGRLVVMDSTGATQKIEGTKDVLLPAWSNDATRIAYLEGRGRGKYEVVTVAVSK